MSGSGQARAWWRSSTRAWLTLLVAACSGRGEDQGAKADTTRVPPAADTAPIIATPSRAPDTTMTWERLAGILRSDTEQVLAVKLGPGTSVTVRMKDGQVYQASGVQPAAVERLLRQVDPSGSILVARD